MLSIGYCRKRRNDTPIYCAILNKIYEVHALQLALPKARTESFIEELDRRKIGSGGTEVLQALEKKIDVDLVASLQNAMYKVDTQEKERSQQHVNYVLESACFNTEYDSQPKLPQVLR